MTNLTLSEAEAEPLPHWEEPALPVRLLRWLRRDPRAAISLGILVIILGAALLAPWIAPYSPTDQNDELILAGPSAAHWLGTDDLGRDVLSRLIHGGANSLYAALLADRKSVV